MKPKEEIVVPKGFLTAEQFAHDCRSKGLPIPVEHTLWIIDKKLISPIDTLEGVDYYSEYQIYILDLIEDRRLQSLDYPKPSGVTRSGKKSKFYSPAITWEEYVLLNKQPIIQMGAQWNPIAELILEIQIFYNAFFNKALVNKEKFEKLDRGTKEDLNVMLQSLIERMGPEKARTILKKYPDLSEDILRFWNNNALRACAIKHNPVIRLAHDYPNLIDIFAIRRVETANLFTRGNPIRLSNFYLQTIFYLNFFIQCLNGGKEPEMAKMFISNYSEKSCEICHVSFLPNQNRRGGRVQKICGKESCKSKWHRQNAANYRKHKK